MTRKLMVMVHGYDWYYKNKMRIKNQWIQEWEGGSFLNFRRVKMELFSIRDFMTVILILSILYVSQYI